MANEDWRKVPVYRQDKSYTWRKNWSDFIYYKFFSTGPDCDSHPDVMEIYAKMYQDVFDWDGEKLIGKKSGMLYRGDTMTSAITVFKRYLVALLLDEDPSEEQAALSEWFSLSRNHRICIPKEKDKSEYKVLNDYLKDMVGKEKNEAFITSVQKAIGDTAEQFTIAYSTIGNFLPVPPGFNVNRSSYGEWDTADRMLGILYYYFLWTEHPQGENPLFSLFNSQVNTTVENCLNWFEDLGINDCRSGKSPWQCFVEKNYLQSFVDEKWVPIELKTGKPLEHIPQASLLPAAKEPKEEKEHFSTFFETAVQRINNRTSAILQSI